jgi:formylglycine-generating enzyme required for sulfatase activity/tRNA A-37 threonylcarbamoyl transferase component Bud32
MTVKVQCPNPACGETTDVAEERLGHAVRCPHCGHTFTPHAAPDESLPTLEPRDRGTLLRPAEAPALPAGLPPELANHPRYCILRELGRGGMGIVYQARQTLMNRQVVIKVINKALLDNPDALERFHREVEAAARLAHPNIVTAYDAEQASDLHMLVMEFVPGQNLAEVLQKKGPLPVVHACVYARQAALGLQHAHEQGMVHRDIKPHNLMLTPKGQVKILDFGLAKLVSENRVQAALTALNSYMGTPDYSAPEQATDARKADIRADIYSLGCTLYCLLAGRPPFQEETPVQTILAHLEKEPPPLPELRPDVPAALWAVVARMLAKDPALRYQKPAEVAQALAPFGKPTARATPGAVTATARSAGGPAAPPGTPSQVLRSPQAVPQAPTSAAGSPFADLAADVQPRKSAKAAADAAPAGRLWWIAGGAMVAGVSLVFLGGVCAGVLHLRGWGSNARDSRDAALVSRSTIRADQPTGKEAAQPVVAPLAKDFTNSISMKLVLVPRGSFWMGERGSQRQVEIPRDFYLGVFPVTQEQWQAVMGSNPSWFSRSGGGTGKVKGISDADLKQFPVEQVSWDDAQEFLKRLKAREKDSGYLYRLPTEAEWEYACRGGATSQEDCAFDFYCGQPSNDLSSEQANFDGRNPAGSAPKGKWLERTSKVGSYQPNRLGLHDMHGNVWEWCADPFEAGGSVRVFRGGGWDCLGSACRASARSGFVPSDRNDRLGVRLAAVPSGG